MRKYLRLNRNTIDKVKFERRHAKYTVHMTRCEAIGPALVEWEDRSGKRGSAVLMDGEALQWLYERAGDCTTADYYHGVVVVSGELPPEAGQLTINLCWHLSCEQAVDTVYAATTWDYPFPMVLRANPRLEAALRYLSQFSYDSDYTGREVLYGAWREYPDPHGWCPKWEIELASP